MDYYSLRGYLCVAVIASLRSQSRKSLFSPKQIALRAILVANRDAGIQIA